jgi:hypothetical protein
MKESNDPDFQVKVNNINKVWKEKVKNDEQRLFFGVTFDKNREIDLEIKYLLYAFFRKRGGVGKFFLRAKSLLEKFYSIDSFIKDDKHKEYKEYLFGREMIGDKEWPLLEKALKVISRAKLEDNNDFKAWKEHSEKLEKKPEAVRKIVNKKKEKKRGVVNKSRKGEVLSNDLEKKFFEIVKDEASKLSLSEIEDLLKDNYSRIANVRGIQDKMSSGEANALSQKVENVFIFLDDIFLKELYKRKKKWKMMSRKFNIFDLIF